MDNQSVQYLTPGKQFIYQNASFLANKFIEGEDFLIEKTKYDEQHTSEICRAILNLQDVKGAYPGEDGITVYLF